MNLNIIKGRSGSGKTSKLLSHIKKDVDNLIITTEPSIYYIEKMLAKNFIPAKVISYNTIAKFIVDELGIIYGTEINKETQIIMIGKIIKENKDKMHTFTKVGYSNTSLNKIYNFIVECREQNIGLEELKQAYENSNNILRDKLHDIIVILEIFNEQLRGKTLVTNEDLVALAIKSLSECDEFTYKNVLVDALDSYTKSFVEIIKRLMPTTEEMSMAFRQTTVNAYDYHICKESMDAADKILEYAMELPYVSIDQIEVKKDKDDTNGINIIERELFSNDTETISNSENIILHEASTMYKEIDFISSEIKKLLINKKVAPEDIIITSSAIDRYINIVATSLKKHNINYFYYKNNQLSKSYLYNFLEASLDIVKKGYTVENILNIAQFEYMELTKEERSVLDSFFVRFGSNLDVALRNGEKYDNANYIQVINVINKIRFHIDTLISNMDNSKNAKEYMVAIFNYLNEFNIKERYQQEYKELLIQKNIPESNKIKSVWNGFVKLLNEIYNIFGEEPLKISDFLEVLNKMAEDTLLSTTQQYYGQVNIIDLKQAQNKKSKILFVIGCNENYFPEHTPQQIVVDNERKMLNLMLGSDFKLSKDFEIQKQAAIYSTLVMPDEKLYISWSLNDLDSKPLKHASIINNIVKTFNSNIVKEKDFYDNDREEAFLEFLSEIAYYKNTGNQSENLSSKYLDFISDKKYSERLYKALGLAIIDKRQINAENVVDAYKETDFFAVTRMENFNQCPFRHFIEYALKPEKLKVFDETAADKGNYFHEVMKKFFDYIMKKKIDIDKLDEEDFNDIIEPIIDELGKTHNDSIFESTSKFIFESYKIKERIRVSAWNAIKQLRLGSFDVARTEYVVGKEVPLDIQLEDGKIVHVVGIIDRLDITSLDDEKYARIIDYKSGNIVFSPDLLSAGTQLQLPLYAKAMSEDFKIGGMYYFHVINPITDADDKNDTIEKKFQLSGPTLNNMSVINANDYNLSDASYSSKVISAETTSKGDLSKRSKVVEKDELESILETSVDVAKETIAKITSGETKAYPFKYKDSDACKYCKYSAICHFDSTIKDSRRTFKKNTEEEA